MTETESRRFVMDLRTRRRAAKLDSDREAWLRISQGWMSLIRKRPESAAEAFRHGGKQSACCRVCKSITVKLAECHPLDRLRTEMRSVALSADGNTALIGGPNDNPWDRSVTFGLGPAGSLAAMVSGRSKARSSSAPAPPGKASRSHYPLTATSRLQEA